MKVAVHRSSETTPIIEIHGVHVLPMVDSPNVARLRLDDIRVVDMSPLREAAYDILNAQLEVPKHVAMSYAEEIADLIRTREIARALAERVTFPHGE